MLKLEEKDYDLNFLFQFSFDFAMLKEILIKLAKSNKDLESRIKNLEKSNKEKDNRISNLEEKLNISYIPEEKSNILSDEDKEDNKDINDIEDNNDFNKSNLDEDNNSIKNKDSEKNEKEKGKEKEKEKGKGKEKEKEKEESFEENDDINKGFEKKRSRTIKITRKNYDNLNSYVSYPISSDAIRSLLKLIKENTEKISKLDKNLNKRITKSFNELQKDLKNIDSQNEKDHKIMKGKIKDLYNRLNDCSDKMDGIFIKTAPLDNLMIFKDSGNGTVDASRAMIKTVEEKINKRIEIIEKRRVEGNTNNMDNIDLKQKLNNLQLSINQLNKEIDLLKNNNNADFEDSIKELKDLIDKKNKDLLAIIEDLSNKLKNNEFAGEKMDDILKNIKTEKDKKIKIVKKETKKYNNEKQNAEINEKLSDLKERIKDLNKKINDIDNYFKIVLNNQGQDLGEIKRTIEEIDTKLEKKITKDDLKELYNTTEEHTD